MTFRVLTTLRTGALQLGAGELELRKGGIHGP
jgi:hypothetical protein